MNITGQNDLYSPQNAWRVVQCHKYRWVAQAMRWDKIPTEHGKSSGRWVLLQQRLYCVGKLRKGGRRHQAETEKSWASQLPTLPLYPLQSPLGWIVISSMLLWKESSPLGHRSIKSERNLLIFSKVIVTVQFTLGREGSNSDSSNITLLGSADYKTALSYSFEG